jgi:transposase
MEVRLSFGVMRLVCEVAEVPRPQQTVIGVDLGVNTLLAATDGAKVFLVSGRGVKAVIQWRNKTLAAIQQAQAGKTTGSLRWKRLQRRKYHLLDKTKRQVRDATHKATHAIAAAFPGATLLRRRAV